jgi:hypothetical protein
MVAKVRSESSRNILILASVSYLSSSSSLKSEGDNEKKAISEPEAKPEMNNNKQANTPANMAPSVGDINVTSEKIC